MTRSSGCADDATNALGYWTLIIEAELVSALYLSAVEVVAAGVIDETIG